jgi:hypothetical protein
VITNDRELSIFVADADEADNWPTVEEIVGQKWGISVHGDYFPSLTDYWLDMILEAVEEGT